jgi:ubiquinone/menaquinone biosynthesis C-methylase UbiE
MTNAVDFVEGANQSEGKSSRRPHSLWQLHRFSYSLGFHSLSRRHAKSVATLFLEPCNYWRNIEIPATLNHLRVQPGERVLDIGSPKLPSLFLSHRVGANVFATDIFSYFFEEYKHYLASIGPPPTGGGYQMEIQDARSLTYPDSHFDKVYAISVLEHIEDDGDSRAIREIARVLKPGGVCCLTVPFAFHYYESITVEEQYYKKIVDGKAPFYERHYDSEALQRRLLAPSGLLVESVEYFGERWFRFENFLNAFPRLLKILLAPCGPIFSKIFLTQLQGDARVAAKMAVVVLRKGKVSSS